MTGAAITQTVTLWSHVKRIDIVNKIEHARALYSDKYEDRYRDNIFYAFPVAVPQGSRARSMPAVPSGPTKINRRIHWWFIGRAQEPDVARYLIYRSRTKDVPLSGKPVGEVKPTGYFLQLFRDTGLQPGQTYYYKVLPEDWSGNRQQQSRHGRGHYAEVTLRRAEYPKSGAELALSNMRRPPLAEAKRTGTTPK